MPKGWEKSPELLILISVKRVILNTIWNLILNTILNLILTSTFQFLAGCCPIYARIRTDTALDHSQKAVEPPAQANC